VISADYIDHKCIKMLETTWMLDTL